MTIKSKLNFVSAKRLSEVYSILFELQHRLDLTDEYLLTTTKCLPNDSDRADKLKELLKASESARDTLLTWYLKQSVVELNVTISLLTAKIKFIEFKLGICDGLNLHQSCSLSLIDFCNILSDMTVVNVAASEKKTLKQISAEVGVPVWLSHYRNQICHVPSESPCISILVPLVAKALNYMQESFWTKALNHESFDEQKFKKYMNYISKLTYVTSMNKRLHVKKGTDMGKKKREIAEENLVKYSKICLAFRRMIILNPQQSINVLTRFISSRKFHNKSRNSALLIEQIIFAKQFESFVFKLISLIEEDPNNGAKYSWLRKIIGLIGQRKKNKLRDNLKQMELSSSPQIIRLTDVPSLKCCQIAYRLVKMGSPNVRKLIIILKQRFVPILGREKASLMIEMTKLMKGI